MCFNKIIEKQFGFLPCIIEECSSCEKYEKRWELPLQKKVPTMTVLCATVFGLKAYTIESW